MASVVGLSGKQMQKMLSRRNTLKLGLAASLAGLASRSHARDMAGKTVIVVGAGIAGLAAARYLHVRGADVLVLEAGDYVGGRIRTDMSMGAPFEYGAGWIHGPSAENPVRQLADEIGAPTFVTDDDSLEVFGPDGNPLSDGDYQSLEDTFGRLEHLLSFQISERDARSIAEIVAEYEPDVLEDPLGRWLLTSYLEFDFGAGIEDVSAANAYADMVFEDNDVIFTRGYDSILAPLAKGLDIRLNTPVNRIACKDEGVEVNELAADYAICTVPLGVLKSCAIRFDPPLPEHIKEAISSLGFGSVTKIALRFKEAFWDVETQYFGIMSEPKGRWNYWLNYRTFSDENILLGLSFGRYAPIADRMNREEMTRDALSVLRSVWGRAVSDPQSVLTTHWSEYANFKGAYSYPQAGGSPSQFEVFAQPVKERLFFAGEHTIFDYHSTTHGALMSGERAAKGILNS